jgi:hypothetical protein
MLRVRVLTDFGVEVLFVEAFLKMISLLILYLKERNSSRILPKLPFYPLQRF